MAGGNGNAEFCKKNSKFESFLKRSLTEEQVEKIRAYESCIIVSEKENKAFKFTALSDERIYLTENPPKSIQEAIHLKDVVSVELVNEYPDFLSGQERDNTQHIQITYMCYEPSKRRSLRRSKKSPRSSLSESVDRSNASTPMGYSSSLDSSYPTDDQGYVTHSSGSRPASRGSNKGGVQSKKKKKKTPGMNDSWDHDSILRSLKEEIEEDFAEDRLSDIKSRSNSKINSPKLSRLREENNPRVGSSLSQPEESKKTVEIGELRSVSQQSFRPLPHLQELPRDPSYFSTTNNNEEKKSWSCSVLFPCCKGHKNQVSPFCKSANVKDNKNSNSSNKLDRGFQNLNTNNSITGSQVSGHVGMPWPVTGQPVFSKGSRAATPGAESDKNINDLEMSTPDLNSSRQTSFIGASMLSVDGLVERRKCVMSIYLLNLSSPLIILIKSAWKNYIIRSTMSLEPETIEISTDCSTTLPTGTKLESQYNRLRRQLLTPGLAMDDIYSLTDQLYSAARESILFKKIFWRNGDLFQFFVSQLQKYLPKSSALFNTEEGKSQRADEIEYVTLILSCLNCLLRETEILPSRLLILRLENCKVLFDLLTLLMYPPDLPYQPLTLTKHWSTPASLPKEENHANDLDKELVTLKIEYTRTSIASVFEIFLTAKQVPFKETGKLTVPAMVELFVSQNTAEKFVDRLLSHIMELVSLSRFDLLTPTQSMHAYQLFYLLLIFLQETKTIGDHVRNNYYEEFKYFIQAPAVARKLPECYPITAPTLRVIEQVVKLILGN